MKKLHYTKGFVYLPMSVAVIVCTMVLEVSFLPWMIWGSIAAAAADYVLMRFFAA